MSTHDFREVIRDCIKIFDENIDILSDIDDFLDSERGDLKPVSTKTELIDMVHAVADSIRIKNAESNFVHRYVERDS